jgi:hypothetical protein
VPTVQRFVVPASGAGTDDSKVTRGSYVVVNTTPDAFWFAEAEFA